MEPSDLDISPPPTEVWDLAVACIASVKTTVEIELDFTQDTLPILDHYVKSVLKDEDADRLLELTAPICGAYFGEVVRRHTDGVLRWYAPQGQLRQWRLELEPAFLYFNPVGLALEVIRGEETREWSAHYEVLPRDRDRVDESVKVLGDVREEDYYSFSMRFEVLEQVIQTLSRIASTADTRPYFGPDAYELFAAKRAAELAGEDN